MDRVVSVPRSSKGAEFAYMIDQPFIEVLQHHLERATMESLAFDEVI